MPTKACFEAYSESLVSESATKSSMHNLPDNMFGLSQDSRTTDIDFIDWHLFEAYLKVKRLINLSHLVTDSSRYSNTSKGILFHRYFKSMLLVRADE